MRKPLTAIAQNLSITPETRAQITMSTQQQLDALAAQMRADEIRRQLYATPQPAGGRGVLRSPPSLPSKKRKVSADSGYGSIMASPTPPEKKKRRKASSPAPAPPPAPPAEVSPSFDEVWRDFSATFGYCFSADMSWFEASYALPESPAPSTPIPANRQQTGGSSSFGPSESVLANQIKFQQQSKAMQARLRQQAQAPAPAPPPPTPTPCVIDLTQDDPRQNDAYPAIAQDIGCTSQQSALEKPERSLAEIERDLAAALAAWRREESLE